MKYRTQLITFLEKKSFSKIIEQNYNFHITTNSSDLLTILTDRHRKNKFLY